MHAKVGFFVITVAKLVIAHHALVSKQAARAAFEGYDGRLRSVNQVRQSHHAKPNYEEGSTWA